MKLTSLCSKCPYKLGLVETFANPCPQCVLDDYKMYDEFKSHFRDKNIRISNKAQNKRI